MALIKGHRRWDTTIIVCLWLIPFTSSLIWPAFWEKWFTQLWVMTWSTNVLAVWIAIILNKDEHLEKMKTHMEVFPKFEKSVTKFIKRGTRFIKRAGKSLKPIEEALADPVAVVREHKGAILAELFPEEEEDGEELEAIPLVEVEDVPPLLTIIPTGEEKY